MSPTAAELTTRALLEPGRGLPLVIQPAAEAIDLAEWAAANRADLAAELSRHGAILFRGFDVHSAAAFERFAHAACPDLLAHNPEHVPLSADGTIQTPVHYAPYRKLLWHNENSFQRRWPTRIMFACQQPADRGGETPLVDSRAVLRRIPSRIHRTFGERKIMYVRTLGAGVGLDWRTVFHTEDRARVEAACRQEDLAFEWLDGDRLRTRAIRPVHHRHPVTGETVWFAQPQHWHTACLDAETRASLVSIFGEDELPRSCRFGDGSPIPDDVMAEICQAYQDLETAFRWLRGDVLLVDNVLTAHARNPYAGERKLLVAMGGMREHDD